MRGKTLSILLLVSLSAAGCDTAKHGKALGAALLAMALLFVGACGHNETPAVCEGYIHTGYTDFRDPITECQSSIDQGILYTEFWAAGGKAALAVELETKEVRSFQFEYLIPGQENLYCDPTNDFTLSVEETNTGFKVKGGGLMFCPWMEGEQLEPVSFNVFLGEHQ